MFKSSKSDEDFQCFANSAFLHVADISDESLVQRQSKAAGSEACKCTNPALHLKRAAWRHRSSEGAQQPNKQQKTSLGEKALLGFFIVAVE